MEDTSQLVWGILFGIIGLGFFTYGRKQQAIVPLVVGIALFIFPYFVSSLTMLIVIGVILIITPYFVKI